MGFLEFGSTLHNQLRDVCGSLGLAGSHARCMYFAKNFMIDIWTKQLPQGKTVVFKMRGTRKAGFEYSARVDGKEQRSIKKVMKTLNRTEVEKLFQDYMDKA